ncbi:hypothetical protein NPIL_281411 [Nephila pilipes]|uniref:Uncharacterized protein n=1 Tax=Nephila pilipes TaxID=299642 RepID=A0A8X6UDZ8_NEPPI|nr:hypothetical protein NPIL_281411 [Nephila pilipes]
MAQKLYESLLEFTVIIEKVKNIVKLFKQSVAGSEELWNTTERKLIPLKNMMKVEFHFNVLERFLELREVVIGIVNFKKSAPPMPFVGGIEFLQEFCTLFKSNEFTTIEATGERLVTSSTVIPIVKTMGSKINSVTCC